MEAINHDHDKMHQDFLLHVRRKKKFDYFTLINISNLIETSFLKSIKQNIVIFLFITVIDKCWFSLVAHVTLNNNLTPMLISVLSPIRCNFKKILFLTVYHLEHYILRSYHCKVLSMFICKLSNVIWKVIAISCQQHLKKNRFQNIQNLFCRVEFLISIEK